MTVTARLHEHWFMRPDALRALAPQLFGGNGDSWYGRLSLAETGVGDYAMRDDVALIHVVGPLSKHGLFSGTSYSGLRRSLAAAVGDERVSAIALSFDTPGGSGWGLPEAADAVARAAAEKPVFAIADGSMICSAGYWLASAATKVYATRASEVGSIGSWRLLVDTSKAWEQLGVKFHALRSAPNKARGELPGDAISEEDLAWHQSSLMGHARLFYDTVREGRGLTDEQVDAVTTGDIWTAVDAKRLGLVDEVVVDFEHALQRARKVAASRAVASAAAIGNGTVSDLFEATVASTQAARIEGAGEQLAEVDSMAEQTTKPIESIEALEAAHGSLVASVRDTAARDATASERERCARILKNARPGQMEIAAACVADGVPVADAFERLMADPRRDAAATAAQRMAAAPAPIEPLAPAAPRSEAVDRNNPDSVWNGSARVRAMFGEHRSYFDAQWPMRDRITINGQTLAALIEEATR